MLNHGFKPFIKQLIIVACIGIGLTASTANSERSNHDVAPASVNTAVSPQEGVKPEVSNARIWNLQDADILSIINEVSQETGKNFVIDPRVSGKITLISSKPVKKDEIYQVFLSILSMLGYSAVPSGQVTKIVPSLESGEQATRVGLNKSNGKGDEVVVRIIPLQHISATQLIPVLRPLLPQWGNVASYTPGNVLILLGRASSLDRIYNIIQDVDEAADNSIQLVPLKHAAATQVATVLTNLQNAARASGETAIVSIAVDDRSNSLLLSGPKPLRLKMRILISQLDAPTQDPAGNTEVVYLRYLQAKTFAPLLSRIAQNIMGKESKDSGSGGTYEMTTTSNDSTNNGPNSTTTVSTMKPDQSSSANNNAPITINSSYIQAEPNSNAVVITAPRALMKAIKAVITKLDVRPKQVLVEAIIAEVDEANLNNLGIQWGTIGDKETVQASSSGTATSFPNLGAGIVGIMPHVPITAVLSILRNQNGVDILSTPSVVVLDNQEATIEVGQDVPVQTGTYATTGGSGSVTPFNTFDRKPVTLSLDVTPQINLASSVRLKLKLKNDTLQNPQNPGLQPLINTSKISNSVIINSDDVLVLGGLISHSNNENTNKVPILSKMPVVGPLFEQKTTNQQKRNLMVFIKPVIMRTGTDASALSYERYNAVRKTQANFRDDLAEIGEKPVPTKLPPWKNKRELPVPFENEQ